MPSSVGFVIAGVRDCRYQKRPMLIRVPLVTVILEVHPLSNTRLCLRGLFVGPGLVCRAERPR